MKGPGYVNPEYPTEPALAENLREIVDIAKECGAAEVVAVRQPGAWSRIVFVGGQFVLPDCGLVLLVCFPATDGGERRVEVLR